MAAQILIPLRDLIRSLLGSSNHRVLDSRKVGHSIQGLSRLATMEIEISNMEFLLVMVMGMNLI